MNYLIGFKYKLVIENKRQTCDKTSPNRIRAVGWVSKSKCEDACNADADCFFFSLAIEKSYCALFNACTKPKRQRSLVLVSVYQKIGKSIPTMKRNLY